MINFTEKAEIRGAKRGGDLETYIDGGRSHDSHGVNFALGMVVAREREEKRGKKKCDGGIYTVEGKEERRGGRRRGKEKGRRRQGKGDHQKVVEREKGLPMDFIWSMGNIVIICIFPFSEILLINHF